MRYVNDVKINFQRIKKCYTFGNSGECGVQNEMGMIMTQEAKEPLPYPCGWWGDCHSQRPILLSHSN